jgi:alkylhydroperoxidase/carboxymuconolactone decarboxylase family protein YurZ
MMKQYKMTTQHELIEIVQACVVQRHWSAALKLIELLQNMEHENKNSVLIEIKLKP